MPPKRAPVKAVQWFWWNDNEWVAYSAEQNEALERGRAVRGRTAVRALSGTDARRRAERQDRH